MEKALITTSHETGRMAPTSLARGLGWGLIGGITGTLAMDLTLMGVLAAFGAPILSCFSIVGSTVARFFLLQNVEMAGTIYVGIATHYVVGPVIGTIFGLLVVGVKALHVKSLKKSLLLGILYVEILSQPLLATTPILLKMTTPAMLQWYAGSFVMHMIAGAVLGAVVGCGLRLGASRFSSRNNPAGDRDK